MYSNELQIEIFKQSIKKNIFYKQIDLELN